uniref:Uncharacterized protein n=1 Tax=Rhizophora mucronata TaxID=61149 RepID=A0A2P2QWI3_RHIMU
MFLAIMYSEYHDINFMLKCFTLQIS